MEERVVIACPSCAFRFRVRRSLLGRSARCSQCKHVFDLVVPGYHGETEIMDWLSPAEDGEDNDALNATIAGLSIFESVTPARAKAGGVGSARIKLKLTSIDELGVHFSFSSHQLSVERFRASMPMMCAGCLSTKHLSVYLIRWLDRMSVKGFGTRGTLTKAVCRKSELPSVGSVELLKYFPERNDLPEPFNLPFPYFVCDKCSPEGLVFGTSSMKQGEHCLIRIKNVDFAGQFYAANCGSESADYHKLISCSRLARINTWDDIDSDVRTRIERWYKPKSGEHFIYYIPNIDGDRSQCGSSGIVVTDQRMIAHLDPLWREYTYSGHITVAWQSVAEGVKVEIRELGHGRITFKFDSRSWVNLKQSLQGVKADVRFVGI